MGNSRYRIIESSNCWSYAEDLLARHNSFSGGGSCRNRWGSRRRISSDKPRYMMSSHLHKQKPFMIHIEKLISHAVPAPVPAPADPHTRRPVPAQQAVRQPQCFLPAVTLLTKHCTRQRMSPRATNRTRSTGRYLPTRYIATRIMQIRRQVKTPM